MSSPRSHAELAEAAAAAGDSAAAARHLRALADAQEEQLGAAHPELANTLNNLAIVSERAGDLDGAEAAFRRACAIAAHAFDAGHPLVVTSARNLHEFCEAHGRPYGDPAPMADDVPLVAPHATARSWSTLVVAGVVAGGLAASGLVWLVSRRTESAPEPPAAAETRQAPIASSAAPEPPEPASTPESPARPPTSATPTAEMPSASVRVMSATVCRNFSTAGIEWECSPVQGSASAGPFVFYTRIAAAQPAIIEHRWYRGTSLHQRVSLRVAANTGAGYRTFSRNTIGADRAGVWRVELRDAHDVVLHEETFSVQ